MSRKLALLIGSSTYADPKLRRLEKPDADVVSLARALRNREIGGFESVETSIDESFATVLRRVARLFADNHHDDLLLLYYAGHGVKDEQGQLHLTTTDTDASILHATALGAEQLASLMSRSRSRKQLLILDCCFSGAFTGTRAPMSIDAMSPFADATGRIVLTATDSFQYAWEDDAALGMTNSVFTHYLVEGLTTGKADRDQDGIVTVDEWYEYVYEAVRTATTKQTPQRSVYRGTGTFAIANNPFLRISLPDDITMPMNSVLPSVREGVVPELARLLDDPRLADSARAALNQLSQDRDRGVRAFAARALAGDELSRPSVASEPTHTPIAAVTLPSEPKPETTSTTNGKTSELPRRTSGSTQSEARPSTPATFPPHVSRQNPTAVTPPPRGNPPSATPAQRALAVIGITLLYILGIGFVLLGFILPQYLVGGIVQLILTTTIVVVLWRQPSGLSPLRPGLIAAAAVATLFAPFLVSPLVAPLFKKTEMTSTDSSAMPAITNTHTNATDVVAGTKTTDVVTGTNTTDVGTDTATTTKWQPPVAGRESCYVQVDSTYDQRKADALAAKLIDVGFMSTFVERSGETTRPLFRVRVKFSSEGDATAALSKLQTFGTEVHIVK